MLRKLQLKKTDMKKFIKKRKKKEKSIFSSDGYKYQSLSKKKKKSSGGLVGSSSENKGFSELSEQEKKERARLTRLRAFK